MLDIDSIELHDALLVGISSDFVAKTVTINFAYYAPENAGSREPLTLRFEGVESVANIIDFEKLRKNAFAGNVNYWIPEVNGTSHIYLSDGYIAVTAIAVSATGV